MPNGAGSRAESALKAVGDDRGTSIEARGKVSRPSLSLKRLASAAMLACAILTTACHEEGGVKVRALKFSGVRAFPESQLKGVLATRQSGWLPWSPKHYFDRAEFDADLQRIHAYYADHGYPNQRVQGVKVDISPDQTSVSINVEIDEGEPVIVDEIRFEGFEVLPENARSRLNNVALKVGQPRDRDRVRQSRDQATEFLHDNGYPAGYVDAGERPTATPNHVLVTFRGSSGAPMKFGEVLITGLENVDESIVRRDLLFAPGDEFKDSAVRRTQRRLGQLELFNLVNVSPRLDEAQGDRVPVRITVAEAKPRRLRFGVGYGTEDRARGSLNWQHFNFFGGARQGELDVKASFLTQSIRLSLVEPRLGHGWSINLSGVSEKTRQLTYDSESYGGHATLVFRTERDFDVTKQPARYQVRLGYGNEYLRYGIRPEFLGDLTQRDERIALGLDPDTGRAAGTLAAISVDVERSAVNSLIQPTQGTVFSIHAEHAAPWLLGTYRYDELLFQARGYLPLGGSRVFAARASLGSVAANDSTTVPFSKRYFLGGATSLRGWGRYQVSPLDDQGLPIGGRTLVELSSEIRFPLRGKISGVMFVDAGSVGASDLNVAALRMRVDAGPGLRYNTPIGDIRADIGFQLTPINGLQVNGAPEKRHWRIHLSIGQAF